jgi:hypothetical protein
MSESWGQLTRLAASPTTAQATTVVTTPMRKRHTPTKAAAERVMTSQSGSPSREGGVARDEDGERGDHQFST